MHKLRTLPLAVTSCYATRRSSPSDALQYIEKPCTHCVLHMYFPLKKQVLCTAYMVFHGSSKSSNSSSEEVPKEPPFWSSSPWSLSSRVVVRDCPVRHVRWGPRRPWRTTAEACQSQLHHAHATRRLVRLVVSGCTMGCGGSKVKLDDTDTSLAHFQVERILGKGAFGKVKVRKALVERRGPWHARRLRADPGCPSGTGSCTQAVAISREIFQHPWWRQNHECHVFADRSAYHTHACAHTSLRLSLKRPTGASLKIQRQFERLTQCALDDAIQFGEHDDARCRPAGWLAGVRVYSASDSFVHRTASPTRPNPTRPVRRRKLCT